MSKLIFDSFLRFRIRTETLQEQPPQEEDQEEKQKGKKKQVKLLAISELPPWSDPNPYILTGYRPVSNSWLSSLASWTYPHNESANIYSHLLPGLCLLLSQGWVYEYVSTRYATSLTDVDWMIVSVQLLSGTVCLLTSTMYHTGLNHSADVAGRWLQMDYVGILGLILGNFVSGLHFGFYCLPAVKYFYWGLMTAIGLTTATILLSPRFRGPDWRLFRLGSFVATGLSAFAPIGHAWVLCGPLYVWGIGVPYYLLEGVLLVIGCCFWERRFPERLYPGKFDLWGHSHTMWHMFVTLAIGAHIWGLLSAMDYIYRQASSCLA